MTKWVVVGAGAAGCVLAARLTEHESNEVVLLEAGGERTPTAPAGEPVLDDAGLLATHAVVRRDGSVAEPYPTGRGLGGSSLVNAGVVVDPANWSTGHDLPVMPVERPGPLGTAVLAATDDAARVGLVARNEGRVTASDAYLVPALDRANLTVRSGVEVAGLAFDGRRCLGVSTVTGEEVAADRVVLSAGAIGTPTLLLRSGVESPAVGRGLQDHVGVLLRLDVTQVARDGCPSIGVTVERAGRQIVVLDARAGDDATGALLAGHLDVRSRGDVTLRDRDGAPEVHLRQLADRHDLDGLALVVGEALDLVRSDPVRAVVGDVTFGPSRRGDGLVRWLATEAELSGYHHLAGSCRLGTALAADGSLRGYEHLVVCDASALPGVPARNPYLAVVLLAERMAAAWTA